MEDKEIIKEVMQLINIHLDKCLKKSGLRNDIEDIESIVTLQHGENKGISVVLGSYSPSVEEEEKGRIILYIDAISDYSKYIGRNFLDVITKIFFAQVHHYMTYEKGKELDYLKAESFATKICRKLLKQDLIEKLPPIFYIDIEDDNMMYQRLLRRQWFEQWSGIKVEELKE